MKYETHEENQRPEIDELMVDRVQVEAAESAKDVNEFRESFHEGMNHAITAGVDKDVFAERAKVVDSLEEVGGNLQLEEMESNVLGYAQINGGDETIRLNEQRFAMMQTEQDLEEMMQAAAHEQAHAEAMHLQGELIFQGQELHQDEELLQEGFAEKEGNKAVDLSIHEHRKGQPEELYAEGQRTIAAIQDAVGEELIDKVFTETGDLNELQKELDRKGLGRNRQQLPQTLAA